MSTTACTPGAGSQTPDRPAQGIACDARLATGITTGKLFSAVPPIGVHGDKAVNRGRRCLDEDLGSGLNIIVGLVHPRTENQSPSIVLDHIDMTLLGEKSGEKAGPLKLTPSFPGCQARISKHE